MRIYTVGFRAVWKIKAVEPLPSFPEGGDTAKIRTSHLYGKGVFLKPHLPHRILILLGKIAHSGILQGKRKGQDHY